MKVSIVIPCYNEKNTIEEIAEAVRSAPIENKEIIVVDDCSGDGTRALLEERLSRVVDRIIYHPANRGKGAALNLKSLRNSLGWVVESTRSGSLTTVGLTWKARRSIGKTA